MSEEQFIEAINNKTKIRLTFFSKEDKHNITRLCAPMDFGPSRRAHNQDNRFHLWDYESDKKNHSLSLLPNQIVSMEFTDEQFDPSEFVTWEPNWFIARDWAEYS
jgi:hypothetical protein